MAFSQPPVGSVPPAAVSVFSEVQLSRSSSRPAQHPLRRCRIVDVPDVAVGAGRGHREEVLCPRGEVVRVRVDPVVVDRRIRLEAELVGSPIGQAEAGEVEDETAIRISGHRGAKGRHGHRVEDLDRLASLGFGEVVGRVRVGVGEEVAVAVAVGKLAPKWWVCERWPGT